MSFAYDQLWDFMSSEERTTIRNIIVDKGLRFGLAAHREAKWFTQDPGNWNMVTNGGFVVGTLAVSGDVDNRTQHGIVDRLFDAAVHRGMGAAIDGYAPDGLWFEGPSYHNYACAFLFYASAALRSAIGSDEVLGRLEDHAVDKSGLYPIYSISPYPVLQYFNWADTGEAETDGESWSMHYAATRFNKPEFSYWAAQLVGQGLASPDHKALLFFDPNYKAGRAPLQSLPASRQFNSKPAPGLSRAAGDRLLKKNMVFLRDSWSYPFVNDSVSAHREVSYIAMKGGCNTYDDADDAHNNHGHMDVGSFVLDSQGARFIIDNGHDTYDLQGYFGKQRFNYYRLSAQGHNVITLGGMEQSRLGNGSVVAFSDKEDPGAKVLPNGVLGVVNSTNAYQRQGVTSTLRGAALSTVSTSAGSERIHIVRDEMVPVSGASHPYDQGCDGWECVSIGAIGPAVSWHAHTLATATPVAGIPLQGTATDMAVLRLEQHSEAPAWSSPRTATAFMDGPVNMNSTQGDMRTLYLGLWVDAPALTAGSSPLAWNVTALHLLPPQDPSDGISRIEVSFDPAGVVGAHGTMSVNAVAGRTLDAL